MSSTNPLSQDQRNVLFHLLESRLAEFKQERLTQLYGLTQAESAREVLSDDADDASQRASEHEVEAIITEMENTESSEIANALGRVHEAAYGICIDCQAPIPYERLLLEPQAQRCTICQTTFEGKH